MDYRKKEKKKYGGKRRNDDETFARGVTFPSFSSFLTKERSGRGEEKPIEYDSQDRVTRGSLSLSLVSRLDRSLIPLVVA